MATRTIRGIATEVVLTEDDGMPTACALNFDHVSLARKERIGATIARLDEDRWREVERALLVACGSRSMRSVTWVKIVRDAEGWAGPRRDA